MSDPTPPTLTTAPFGLPRALRELLRREVAIELGHQRLSAALAEVEQEADTLEKTRPPFLFLHSKSTRTNFNRQLLGASESLTALTEGLEKIERVQPLLRAWVEDEVESHLRANQEAYVNGLASHRYPEDWERWKQRLSARILRLNEYFRALSSELGRVEPTTVVGEDAQATEMLSRAAQVGAAVDAEVTFFNRVADTQRRLLPMGTESMKRLSLLGCEASLLRLRTFPAGQALKILGEFIANYQTQLQQVRGAVVTEGGLAVAPDGMPRGYVLAQWDAMRKLVRLDLDPDAIDQLVAETEALLDSHV